MCLPHSEIKNYIEYTLPNGPEPEINALFVLRPSSPSLVLKNVYTLYVFPVFKLQYNILLYLLFICC